MGYFDHMYDRMHSVTYLAECLKCGTDLRITETDQIPGFRSAEVCVCPVCKTLLQESREVEYDVSIESPSRR